MPPHPLALPHPPLAQRTPERLGPGASWAENGGSTLTAVTRTGETIRRCASETCRCLKNIAPPDPIPSRFVKGQVNPVCLAMKIALKNAFLVVLTMSGLCVVVALVFFLTMPFTGLVSFTPPVLVGFGALSIWLAVRGWGWTGRRLATKRALAWLCRCVLVCFASLAVIEASWNWVVFYMPEVQTLSLGHGYFLKIFQDWDTNGNELAYSLGRQWVFQEREYFANVTGDGKRVPHFAAHISADGGLAWVTADTRPDEVVFLIDFSSAKYWPHFNGSMHWPQQESYLDRINANGGSASFYINGRLDEASD